PQATARTRRPADRAGSPFDLPASAAETTTAGAAAPEAAPSAAEPDPAGPRRSSGSPSEAAPSYLDPFRVG
ncbi:MAG: helix-hairpin-helix domain-containing protein, partial [Actinomycetia bacterium]|nr:helix-hairpin-helix domain-containing protein [Actinomycetes bacterium]